MGRKKATKKPEERSPDTAVITADSFRKLSKVFTDSLIGLDRETLPQRLKEDFGGLVASATNLTLALELYLKSLRIVLGLSVPQHHNLWDLYKAVPQGYKTQIEQRYEKLRQNKKGEIRRPRTCSLGL